MKHCKCIGYIKQISLSIAGANGIFEKTLENFVLKKRQLSLAHSIIECRNDDRQIALNRRVEF